LAWAVCSPTFTPWFGPWLRSWPDGTNQMRIRGQRLHRRHTVRHSRDSAPRHEAWCTAVRLSRIGDPGEAGPSCSRRERTADLLPGSVLPPCLRHEEVEVPPSHRPRPAARAGEPSGATVAEPVGQLSAEVSTRGTASDHIVGSRPSTSASRVTVPGDPRGPRNPKRLRLDQLMAERTVVAIALGLLGDVARRRSAEGP